MDDNSIKRSAKRLDVSYEIKVRFEGQVDYTTVVLKDISVLGIRVIIAGRLIKKGEPLEVKMCINGREILCKGKVTWVLMLKAGLGNITVFDVRVQFGELDAEDKEFLDKLIGKQA